MVRGRGVRRRLVRRLTAAADAVTVEGVVDRRLVVRAEAVRVGGVVARLVGVAPDPETGQDARGVAGTPTLEHRVMFEDGADYFVIFFPATHERTHPFKRFVI